MSEFNLFKCSHFLNSFELTYLEIENTCTYLYGYCVYNQLQNKIHRCQCKQESLANANVKRATAVHV